MVGMGPGRHDREADFRWRYTHNLLCLAQLNNPAAAIPKTFAMVKAPPVSLATFQHHFLSRRPVLNAVVYELLDCRIGAHRSEGATPQKDRQGGVSGSPGNVPANQTVPTFFN